MTLSKSHICKPRVSKCSYETHTMRTQVKQAKSYRNTMAPSEMESFELPIDSIANAGEARF